MIHQLDDMEIRSQQRTKSETDTVEQGSTFGMCRQYVKEEPVKSVLIGLGAGIGAGLLLGALFRESTRYLYHEPGLAERVGNQVKDSLSEIFPGSLGSRFRS